LVPLHTVDGSHCLHEVLLHGQHYMLRYLHHILRGVNTGGPQLLEVESDLDDDLQPTILCLIYLRRVSLGLERGILKYQR